MKASVVTLAAALSALLIAAPPLTGPALGSGLPPGLVSASLLPAAAQPDGTVMTALALELAPGWKTYWRSPGETGIAPVFDWSGAPNVAAATALWPNPQIIESEGAQTLGFRDRLVLPLRLMPADPARPIEGVLAVDLGLCLNICVPAHLRLAAPGERAAALDPRIAAALDSAPRKGEGTAHCSLAPIGDGMRVSVSGPAAGARAAAVEVECPGMWVSEPDLTTAEGMVTAAADVVGPTGKPFALDAAQVRLTLIGDAGAVEYQGCAPS